MKGVTRAAQPEQSSEMDLKGLFSIHGLFKIFELVENNQESLYKSLFCYIRFL